MIVLASKKDSYKDFWSKIKNVLRYIRHTYKEI